MRVPLSLIVLLAALVAAAPVPAAAEAGPAWEACVALASTPDQRVKACSAVIDTRSETGRRLAGAYCNRGHGLTEKRELDAALSDLDEAVRLDPTYACAFNNRGRVYSFKRDYDRAIADYDKAIRLDPSLALAYGIGRGVVRIALDRSIEIREGAVEVALVETGFAAVATLQYDPADVFSWNNRGQARMRLGDKQGAIADFRKALELKPDLQTAQDQLRKLGAL